MNAGNHEGREEGRIQVVSAGQPLYPALLKEIRDYPKTLYYIGRGELLKGRCASVVGSRTTTSYGRNTARAIASALASCGITVVSGMAAGIDSCAHSGALDAGGKTIAVLGTGVDLCYPKDNAVLKQSIEARGLVLSEYPPGTGAARHHFPQRNRIISGLSEVTCVVQARLRSGALITAELAADQGREVLAVPGNIDSQYHMGTNQLIREGVQAVTSVDDVLSFMGLSRAEGRPPGRLSQTEELVYQMLQQRGEMSAEEICLSLSRPPGYLMPILSSLELKGHITSAAGKFFLANR
ncbi:MAG: DNA-processing protein DprA [Firmicutes bacterium]|nr:DNA-processing protein DprA [Bacillota bacterium]